MTVTVRRGKIGEEDISHGTLTFTRYRADGTLETVSMVSADSFVLGENGQAIFGSDATIDDALVSVHSDQEVPLYVSYQGNQIVTSSDWEYEYTGTRLHQVAEKYETGDLCWTFGASKTGFVLLDGGTIGNVGSGATNRANDDVKSLFIHLWDSVADSEMAVSGGRGASAAADFAAGKTLTLIDARGRVPIGGGQGSGLTDRTIGDLGGEEDHTLTTAEMPSHTHTVPQLTQTAEIAANATNVHPTNTQSSGSAGSDDPHNNMQPWFAVNCFIKL